LELYDDMAVYQHLTDEAFERFYNILLECTIAAKEKGQHLSREEAIRLIGAYPPINAMIGRCAKIDAERVYIRSLLFSEYGKWRVWNDDENDTVFDVGAFRTFISKVKQNYYFHQAFKIWAAMLIKDDNIFLHQEVVECTKPSTIKFASDVLEGKIECPLRVSKKPFSKVALRNTQIYSALKVLVKLRCQPTSNRLRCSDNFSASEILAEYLSNNGMALSLDLIEGIWGKYSKHKMSEKDVLFFSDECTEFDL